MRIFGLIAGYAVALFLTGWLLLVESMLVSELTSNKELDMLENDGFIDFEQQAYSFFSKATLTLIPPKPNTSWQD